MPYASLRNIQIKEYKEALKNKKELSDEEKLVLNSRSGLIFIKKISDNPGYIDTGDSISGFTHCFGVGIALFIENANEWFHTSVIQSIGKDSFKTKNSIYSYTFIEDKNEEQ